MKFLIKVVVNARNTEIVAWEGNVLKIRLSEPAIEGRANKELIKFLSKMCNCAKSEIEILKGLNSRSKAIDIPDDCIDKIKKPS